VDQGLDGIKFNSTQLNDIHCPKRDTTESFKAMNGHLWIGVS